MSSYSFTKLFSSITDSSIWSEDSDTKVVWVTLLAMADSKGRISAAIPGVSKRSGVNLKKTEEALIKFESPDKYSRSTDFEGRRIAKIDGGWQLLNYEKYREMRNDSERKEYIKEYMREYRARTKNVNKNVNNVNECKPPLTQAEAEAEAEKKKIAVSASPQQPEASKRINLATEAFLDSLKPLYPGVDIKREINKMTAWMLTPRGKGKRLTQRFVVNWLNRCEPTLSAPQSQKPMNSTDFLKDL
jgi:hypothetical protein